MPFEKRGPIDELTGQVNACAVKVHGELGAGFSEKIYENAMLVALRKCGLQVGQQVPFRVHFDSTLVGEYVADLIVENAVVVEIKACDALSAAHRAQCVNYLKASGLGVGLLLNFGGYRLEIRRLVRRQAPAIEANPAPAHAA